MEVRVSGVPVYQLVVHIVIASVLLMAIIYGPLLSSRDMPRWMTAGAVGVTMVLAASATFAIITGHWPNLQFR